MPPFYTAVRRRDLPEHLLMMRIRTCSRFFEAIVKSVPPPKVEESDEFRMLVSNVDWSDYVGRIGIG